MSINNLNVYQLADELASQTTNQVRAELRVTRFHHESTMVQKKRQHLQVLFGRVEQEQQAIHLKTKAAVETLSMINQLVIQLKQDIQIAKDQQQLYNTILYNRHAAVLEECPLTKSEILAKMQEQKVHDQNSMDDFISLLYVEGYLLDIPDISPTGSNLPTTAHEQQGETKEQVVPGGTGTASVPPAPAQLVRLPPPPPPSQPRKPKVKQKK
jgi:hypothetical protein